MSFAFDNLVLFVKQIAKAVRLNKNEREELVGQCQDVIFVVNEPAIRSVSEQPLHSV